MTMKVFAAALLTNLVLPTENVGFAGTHGMPILVNMKHPMESLQLEQLLRYITKDKQLIFKST